MVVLRLLVHQTRKSIDVGEVLVGRVTVQTEGDRGGGGLLVFVTLGSVRRDERAGVGRHAAHEGGEGQTNSKAEA